MEERKVSEYVVVAGLPTEGRQTRDTSSASCSGLDESFGGGRTVPLDPITDVTVVIKSQGEFCPIGFTEVERTPTGHSANLNHGSIRTPEVFLCYNRGRHKLPLLELGVLQEGKERLAPGAEGVFTTPYGRPANVNNSTNVRTFITYRRATPNVTADELVVTDVAIIIKSKGESPPPGFRLLSKNLNRGAIGSEIYMCFKKSRYRWDFLSYEPEILHKYPEEAATFGSQGIPGNLPLFCLPMDACLESWPSSIQPARPRFSTFVMTSETGRKLYGSSLIFYEPFDENELTESERRFLGVSTRTATPNRLSVASSSGGTGDESPTLTRSNEHSPSHQASPSSPVAWHSLPKRIYQNRALCIISRTSFQPALFDAFEKFLFFVHRLTHDSEYARDNEVPIERWISHFMLEVPFPSPQRPRVILQLHNEMVALHSIAEDSLLPLNGTAYYELLRCLGPEMCLHVLVWLLMEQKLVLYSLKPDMLTYVCEAVSTLTFPLTWVNVYVPSCPLSLAAILQTPTPAIIGVDSRYFELFPAAPEDSIAIDVDFVIPNQTASMDDRRYPSVKLLPKKAVRTLEKTLVKLDGLVSELDREGRSAAHDDEFQRRHRQILLGVQIQEAFLRFMATLLRGYKQFLRPLIRNKEEDRADPDAPSLFDMDGFLRSRDKAYSKFYSSLLKTQNFNKFVEDRSLGDNNAGYAFFDECVDRVEDPRSSEETRLLEPEDLYGVHSSQRTVFVPPPDASSLASELKFQFTGMLAPFKNELFISPPKPLVELSADGLPLGQHSKLLYSATKRNKFELKQSMKYAREAASHAQLWAKSLLSQVYALWFVYLPTFIYRSDPKRKALTTAFHVLLRVQNLKATKRLFDIDQVCYRVLMQSSGELNYSLLALKVFYQMKRQDIQPNAITYGLYNKALYESKDIPIDYRYGKQLWRKLQLVFHIVCYLRRAQLRRARDAECLSQTLSVDSSGGAAASSGTSMRKTTSEDCLTKGGPSSDQDTGYHTMLAEDKERGPSQESLSSFSSRDSLRRLPRNTDDRLIRKALTKAEATIERTNSKTAQFLKLPVFSDGHLRHSADNLPGLDSSRGLSMFNSPAESSGRSRSRSNLRATCYFESGRPTPNATPRKNSVVTAMANSSGRARARLSSLFMDTSWRLSSILSENGGAGEGSEEARSRTSSRWEEMMRNDPLFDMDTQLALIREMFSSPKEAEQPATTAQSPDDDVDDDDDDDDDGGINFTAGQESDGDSRPIDPLGAFELFSDTPKVSIKKLPASKSDDPLQADIKQAATSSGPDSSARPFHSEHTTPAKGVSAKPPKSQSLTVASGTANVLSDAPVLFKDESPLLLLPPSSAAPLPPPSAESTPKPTLNILPASPPSSTAADEEKTILDNSNGVLVARNPFREDIVSTTQSPHLSKSHTGIDLESKDESASSAASLMSSTFSMQGFKGWSVWGQKQSAGTTETPPTSASSLKREDAGSSTSVATTSSGLFKYTSQMRDKFSRVRDSFRSPLGGGGSSSHSQTSLQPENKERFGTGGSLQPSSVSTAQTGLSSVSSSTGSNAAASHLLKPHLRIQRASSLASQSSRQSGLTNTSHSRRSHFVKFVPASVLGLPTSASSASSPSMAVRLLEIEMTTCSYCANASCGRPLFDEEILAGWAHDIEHIPSRCSSCNEKLVPLLQVYMKDLRPIEPLLKSMFASCESLLSFTSSRANLDSINEESFVRSSDGGDGRSPGSFQRDRSASELRGLTGGVGGTSGSGPSVIGERLVRIEYFSVNYMPPLVVRKELDSIMLSDGDAALSSPSFIERHADVFWNLVWWFRRLRLPNHLTQLIVDRQNHVEFVGTKTASLSRLSVKDVRIRQIWDDVSHGFAAEIAQPMYIRLCNRVASTSITDALVMDSFACFEFDTEVVGLCLFRNVFKVREDIEKVE